MTLEEKIKIFVTFLKKEGCYEEYRYNIRRNNNALKKYLNHLTLKNIITNCSIFTIVTKPFTWKTTKEGYDYWLKIDRKWCREVQNHHYDTQ